MTAAASPGTALDVATDLFDLRPAPNGARTAATPAGAMGAVTLRGRARFLLPLGWPAATQAACLAFLGLRTLSTQVNRRGVALALRVGAEGRVIPQRCVADTGPDSLVAHLGTELGQEQVAVAMGLGTVDTVWKPTLHVFDPDGQPLAFVKIGRGPVAAELVSRETATLARWGDHPDPRLVVPDLLGATVWRGLPMALVAPLPRDVCRLPTPVSSWPVRLLDPPLPDAPVDDARWWVDRRQRALDDGDTELDDLLDRIEARHRGPQRSWARSHGDWVPWNLARCSRGLVAWDWEYSERGAPVGLDDVHGIYQHHRVVQGEPIASALAAARHDAPSAWLADAHVAMLVTRHAELSRLNGTPTPDTAELRAAARRALDG